MNKPPEAPACKSPCKARRILVCSWWGSSSHTKVPVQWTSKQGPSLEVMPIKQGGMSPAGAHSTNLTAAWTAPAHRSRSASDAQLS